MPYNTPNPHGNTLAFKSGVRLSSSSLDPPMVRCLLVALETSPQLEDRTVVVTSGTDSHKLGYHPTGRGWDFRTRNIVSQDLDDRRHTATVWCACIRETMGKDWDVLLEVSRPSPDNDHVHCEFDPDRGSRWRLEPLR